MSDRDERLDYLGHAVRVDSWGQFEVEFEVDQEEKFPTYGEAKAAIETFVKRHTETLSLKIVDEMGEEGTIEGINRTSGTLRGTGLKSDHYDRRRVLYPAVPWIALTIGKLVKVRAEAGRLEAAIEPYRLQPSLRHYGRMPVSELPAALDTIRTDHEGKLAAAIAAKPYVEAGIERPK